MAKKQKTISERAQDNAVKSAHVEDVSITMLAQLSPGDMLGPQKQEVRAAADKTVTPLGTLIGEVRGLSYRHNPQDETTPSIALVGPFKFVPSSPNRPELRAMRAFLPGAVHDAIVASLEGDNKRPVDKSPGRKDKAINVNIGAVVPVVLEVSAETAESTAVGYRYVTQNSKKVPLQLDDPLARLSALAGVKALPAPGK